MRTCTAAVTSHSIVVIIKFHHLQSTLTTEVQLRILTNTVLNSQQVLLPVTVVFLADFSVPCFEMGHLKTLVVHGLPILALAVVAAVEVVAEVAVEAAAAVAVVDFFL